MTDSEKSTWNSKAAGNHNHDSAYQPKGSYAPSSHGHTASEITLDATHRFVTDTEKNTWSGKAEGNHNHDSVYQAKVIMQQVRILILQQILKKVRQENS